MTAAPPAVSVKHLIHVSMAAWGLKPWVTVCAASLVAERVMASIAGLGRLLHVGV